MESPLSFDPGDLTAQLQWRNNDGAILGTGASVTVPSTTSGSQFFWLTYIVPVGPMPFEATVARVVFSKGAGGAGEEAEEGEGDETIGARAGAGHGFLLDIDLVIPTAFLPREAVAPAASSRNK